MEYRKKSPAAPGLRRGIDEVEDGGCADAILQTATVPLVAMVCSVFTTILSAGSVRDQTVRQKMRHDNRSSQIVAPDKVAPVRLLAALWCSSVGSFWTLELRELDGNTRLGRVVEWISSGVPVCQPPPMAHAHEMLAARGLRLCGEAVGSGTRNRRSLGYVCTNTDLVTSSRTRGLALYRLSAGICVVAVNGELDMVTAPMLQSCARQQLAVAPTHLIVDLQRLRFLGVTGLNCLLGAQELAQRTPGSQLHLAGLASRAVARPLRVTEMVKQFDSYPTLADALAALTNRRTWVGEHTAKQ